MDRIQELLNQRKKANELLDTSYEIKAKKIYNLAMEKRDQSYDKLIPLAKLMENKNYIYLGEIELNKTPNIEDIYIVRMFNDKFVFAFDYQGHHILDAGIHNYQECLEEEHFITALNIAKDMLIIFSALESFSDDLLEDTIRRFLEGTNDLIEQAEIILKD